MLPSINGNSEWESNPMLKPLYLYLCGSAFLVSLTDPDKQFFNVRSVLKFLSHRFSLLEIQSNLFKQAPL